MPDVLDTPEETASLPADVDEQDDSESPENDETPEEKYGPKFLDLPSERVEQLRALCNKFNLRDQWGRQIEILRCTLKRYFWIGLQHVWWNNDSCCFQVGQQGGAVNTAENLNDEQGTSAQDFNIYKPNGKIFTAVFAQNPPSVHMEPDKPKDSSSIRAAREAEKYLKVYDKYNSAQDAQITIGRLLWNDGRVIAITEGCGDTEKTRYAGVLESKVPIYETCEELWPYCKVSKDHDVVSMKQKHKQVADKITAGGKSATPNDEIARMARISTAESITQLSQDSLAYLTTEDEWWLRPSAFWECEDEARLFFVGGKGTGEDGKGTEQEGIFPHGCKLTFIGETFCGAESCALEDHVAVMHAEPGEGQARNSLGDPHVPVQMEFNDAMNLTAELLKYCVPSLWADMDETEAQAIMSQLAQYGQIRFKKKAEGEPLENSFFPEPGVEAPMVLTEWIQNLQGPLTQLVTLNQPAMFGANMEDQKTAKAYGQALQQSLGVLTIVWVPFQNFSAKIHEQAAKIAAKRDEKFAALVENSNRREEAIEIDPLILRGGFVCSPIPAQGFPESWQAKSTTIKGLMAAAPQNPPLAAALQLPTNQELQFEAIGLDEFDIPGRDPRQKQIQEWAEMQEGEGPETDQDATDQREQQRQQQLTTAAAALGKQPQEMPPLPEQPPIQNSSIPVDDSEDHVNEAMECSRILNSPEGQKIKRTKDMGDGRQGSLIWLDLKLHMMEHVKAGKAKGFLFPPPIEGPPPMPIPGAPPPGAGAQPGGASPPAGVAALPPLAQPAPGGLPNATA
jgi:hypothetical protein